LGTVTLGVVVGLEAEAVLARRLGASVRIAISGATADGASRAAGQLLEQGASHLLSFGLAGGLDPVLRAGILLVPERVRVEGQDVACDRALQALLGSGHAAPLLHSDVLVTEVAEKAALFARTGCGSLDMESGAVARVARAAGLPFAVLRAVCDRAARALPPAACLPLHPDGRLRAGAITASVLRHPAQLPALLALGRDAARARTALSGRINGLANRLTSV
jgi:hopanoid-associated phosphorylase